MEIGITDWKRFPICTIFPSTTVIHTAVMTRQRRQPNILVTGTPGTGKTTLAELVAHQCSLQHINVGTVVKKESLHTGFSQEHDAFWVDEDRVCDQLEPVLASGGCVVDFHTCDFFPERWFDLVVVLRTDNSVLYARLEERYW
jgi:adenylate kinase